jgi:dihydroorotate dehydrogenase (NAD+) catalytic subunit
VKIPIVASGGIASAEDALEFIHAGATLVSVGTMNFVEPGSRLRSQRPGEADEINVALKPVAERR